MAIRCWAPMLMNAMPADIMLRRAPCLLHPTDIVLRGHHSHGRCAHRHHAAQGTVPINASHRHHAAPGTTLMTAVDTGMMLRRAPC